MDIVFLKDLADVRAINFIKNQPSINEMLIPNKSFFRRAIMTLCEILKKTLSEKNWEGAKWIIAQLSIKATVDCLRDMESAHQVLVFCMLNKSRAIEVFEMMDRYEQSQLVKAMDNPDLISLIEAMDPDERVQLLEELPAKVVKRILQELSPETRSSLNLLLGYPENSAGRVMNPDYLAIHANKKVSDVLELLRQSSLKPEHLEVVFVLDDGRFYKGYVRLSQLVKASPDAVIGDLITEDPVSVSVYDTQDKVADLFIKHQYPLIAVVDREGRLVGAIDSERGLELVEEYKSQQLTTFGGTVATGGPDIDIISSSFVSIFKARAFWLILLTIFGVFTSTFIAEQEEILASAIVLAAFIAPIIDMGGNTGSQSATLVIRAIALGQTRIKIRDFLYILKRDVPVAIAIGVTIAILEAVLAYFSKGVGADILMVVGLSMLTVTILGSLVGVGLPFVARKMGFDPATLSSPVITSVMDLLGVLIYFGYAYLFLGELLK